VFVHVVQHARAMSLGRTRADKVFIAEMFRISPPSVIRGTRRVNEEGHHASKPADGLPRVASDCPGKQPQSAATTAHIRRRGTAWDSAAPAFSSALNLQARQFEPLCIYDHNALKLFSGACCVLWPNSDRSRDMSALFYRVLSRVMGRSRTRFPVAL
jgi:hypothetical protein